MARARPPGPGAYCVLGSGACRDRNYAHFIDKETEAREGRSVSHGHTARMWRGWDWSPAAFWAGSSWAAPALIRTLASGLKKAGPLHRLAGGFGSGPPGEQFRHPGHRGLCSQCGNKMAFLGVAGRSRAPGLLLGGILSVAQWEVPKPCLCVLSLHPPLTVRRC